MNTPIPPAGNLALQPTPYSIQASCELSQDHFLTDTVPVGADDKVLPFVNTNNNMVEAVVLTHDPKGQPSLAHLHRDPDATSGWTFTTIDTPFGGITGAAVSSSSTHNAMIMAVAPEAPNKLLPACQLSLLEDGSWTCVSNGFVPVLAGPLGAGATAAGDLYWYGWTQQANSKTHNWDYTFWRWNGTGASPGVGNGTVAMTLSFPLSSQTSPVTAHLMLDATVGSSTASCAVVMLNDISSPKDGYLINAYRLTDGNPDPSQIGTSNAGAASLLWSYVSAANTSGAPAQLWQDTNGDISFIDETGAQFWIYDGGSVGDGQVAAWQLDDLYTFTILDQDQTASVVTQIGNPATGFTLPIPLVGGIDRIYSLPTDPTQGTLFAVNTLGILNVLTKDPALGWAQSQVHQDGATLWPVTSWRAQISVLDANGAGVGGGQIQLETDRPVGLWQPVGSTILTPAGPVTMPADGAGKLTVSIPAEELDTAVLTAQALDSSGHPTGTPFTIIPNIDVQNFLAGNGSLTDIGKLTGGALFTAMNPVDPATPNVPPTRVFPNLADPTHATWAAAALNHVAKLGLGYQPSTSSDVQAALFDLTGASTQTFRTSTDPHAFDSLSGTLGATDWWDSAKNDAESAFHGLRHGVIAFKKMVSSWDKDAGQWVVNLTVDIGDGIDNVLTYVISDVKTAIHAISSFFQALGADIKSGWEWLKHNVLELIKNAEANAKQIQSWLAPFMTSLTGIIDTIEISANDYFTSKKTEAHAAIGQLAQDVEDYEFGTSKPLPPPSPDTGSNDADLLFKDGEDVITFFRHISASWLLDKLKSYLPESPTGGGPDFSGVFDQVIQELITDVTGAITLIQDIATTAWAAIEPALTSSGQFTQASMGQFFTDLDGTVNDALKLCDEIAITLLDALKAAITALGDLFAYEFQAPVIGDLLALAGIDTSLRIDHLVALIIAYPATLINQIIGGGPLFPADDAIAGKQPDTELGSARVDGWGVGLNWGSACAQAVWAANDLILDDSAAAGSKKHPPKNQFKGSALTTTLDIVCPVVINMLQFPSPTKDGMTQPFTAGLNTSGEGTDYLPYMLLTSFLPPAAGIIDAVIQANIEEGATDPFGDYGVPIICGISGVINTVLSSIYGKDQGTNALVIAGGVLANVSYDVAWLGCPALVEATDQGTAIAKLIVNVIANFGTAIFMSDQAIAAAAKPLGIRIPL